MYARRSVRWLLVAAAMVVAAMLAAGCGAKRGGSAASTTALRIKPTAVPKVPAATKPLQQLTWNLNFGEPLTMDSGKLVDFDDMFVLSNMCEPLEQLTAAGKIVPALATSIDQTSPTSYTVHLRHGVKFWNGQTMTAADVAFSFNRQLSPTIGSYFMSLVGGAFKSATATGTYTVTLTLTHPNSLFKPLLVTPLSMVMEKSFALAHKSNYGSPQVGPMCTGPYQLVNWNPGQSITIKQFPGWWDAANQKRLTSTAKFVFIGDPNTSTQALLTGEANGEFLVPAASVPRLKTSSGTLVNGPSSLIYTLSSMNKTGPGANVKIRQAVAKLIDYSGFSSTQFLGTASVTRALASPNTWGTEPDIYSAAYGKLPTPTQDVAAAKKLVQESGLKDPVIKVATTPVSLGASELLNQMTQAGKKAGMTIVNKVLSVGQFGTLFTSASARTPYSFMYQEATADIPDPLELYNQIASPTGGENYLGYNNPKVTSLLNQANSTTDSAKRATLATQAQAIITKEAPWIPVVAPYLTTYITNNIGGIQASFPSVMYTPWLTNVGGR